MDPEPSTLSDLRFQQMPASKSDGLLANRAFMRAVDAARAQQEQQKAEAGGLWHACGTWVASRVCAVQTGGNSLAGRGEAARSALFEPTVHGEAVRR